MELAKVLRCIKQLLSPPREGAGLLQSLREVLEAFQTFARRQELTHTLQSTVSGLEIPQYTDVAAKDVAVYCRFTEQGLALLTLLDEALRQAHSEDLSTAQEPHSHQSSPSHTRQPPPPKALLSTSEEKSVHILLQFVVALGVFPFLSPGTGRLLEAQLGHMAALIQRSSADTNTKVLYLYKHCRPLVQLFTTPVIGPLVISHHFSTLLIALLQVCHSPELAPSLQEGDSPTEHSAPHLCSTVTVAKPLRLSLAEVEQCKAELSALLTRLNQPLVVRELVCLQGAAKAARQRPGEGGGGGGGGRLKWLQRACGRLLSERLMQENGVHSVLLGIFDVTMSGEEGVGSGCHGDWKRIQSVAEIISRCPSQASSLSHYYSIIAPQLVKLLELPGRGRATVQVTAATISLMVKQQPSLARAHLIHPLTHPLRLLSAGDITVTDEHTDISTAIEMSVGSIHKLCGCIVDPSSPVMSELQPLLPIIFKIWEASTQAEKTSKTLRSASESVLMSLFNSLKSRERIHFLRHLAGLPEAPGSAVQWMKVSPELTLKFSSDGVLCVGSVNSAEVWSAERMEREARAVLELVGRVLSSSGLTGQLFLECLTCVAACLCRDVGYQPQSSRIRLEMKALSVSLSPRQPTRSNSSASSALLDIERSSGELSQSELYHRSLALYLTAALSEERTSDILEEVDKRTLLEVLAVVVECHAHFVKSKHKPSSASSPVNLLMAQPGLDSVLGGPITLSIALGYLSAILTGANQIDKESRHLLSSLLQPLETISRGYPDQELAELAGDVRVCVATLGAVWSREMREWGRREGERWSEAVVLNMAGETKETDSSQESEGESEPRESDRRHTLVEEMTDIVKQSPYPQPEPTEKKETESDEEPSKFKEALSEALDPQAPIRGHGLASLAKLVKAGDKETLSHSTKLLEIFKAALLDSDSYVYLPAIGGLVSLSVRHPLDVLAVLCDRYSVSSETATAENKKKKVDRETGKLKVEPAERSGVKDLEQSRAVSVEVRLKIGEVLVRVCRECGQLLPHYSEGLLAAVLSCARDPHPLLRASALSCLADICQLLGHSFARNHHEILGCVKAILLSDPTPQVQQSALLVLTLLLKGLSRHSVEVLGDSLRDVYRILKRVEGERERDEATRDHARAALGELNHIMRDWAFPQPTLTKNITLF